MKTMRFSNLLHTEIYPHILLLNMYWINSYNIAKLLFTILHPFCNDPVSIYFISDLTAFSRRVPYCNRTEMELSFMCPTNWDLKLSSLLMLGPYCRTSTKIQNSANLISRYSGTSTEQYGEVPFCWGLQIPRQSYISCIVDYSIIVI